MDNFKLASQQKLRFHTKRGMLSSEQLWDLPLEELDDLALALEEEHKQSGKKSFILKGKTDKDKIAKLRFDIVLDVLNTKLEEAEAAQKQYEDKEHNKKIIELIAEKKDDELKGKSVKQLEAMLK